MVERNLAKVEVASSSLVSRSSLKKGRPASLFCRLHQRDLRVGDSGALAKRLCNGLQIRLGRFDSASRLQELVDAGVAQLVERNLAKVEVESSRLFSRSRIQKGSLASFFLLRKE